MQELANTLTPHHFGYKLHDPGGAVSPFLE